MQVLNVLELGGPNRWADVPVMEVLLASPSSAPPTTLDRLRCALTTIGASLPPPSKLAASGRSTQIPVLTLGPSGDVGASLAAAFHSLWQALQSSVGVFAEFKLIQPDAEPHQWRSIVQFEHTQLAVACAHAAQRLCKRAVEDQPLDVEAEVRALVDLADSVRLGPSTRAITEAAAARGIPVLRLNSGSLVQLGEGKQQRRIWTAETSATSGIAMEIAQNKQLTRRLLAAAGVPVPQGRQVKDAEDAWAVASAIGLPVVVKPCDANHARGVSLNLSTRDEVLAAYDFAIRDGETTNVLVEQFARGDQHRLLIVQGKLVAAARGESEHVVGDGVRTIRELVEVVNLDPRRGENYTDPLSPLKLDQSALLQLRKQDFDPESVLPAGRRALIQRIGDLTTDCTDDVHPSVAAAVVLAAKVVGLDIAGVDLVTEDIRRPLEEQGGAIVEVNAGPSLSMHLAPLRGRARPVGEAIVDSLFSRRQMGRIPIFGIAGNGPRGAVAELLAALLRSRIGSVGLSTAAQEPTFCDDNLSPVERMIVHPDHGAIVFASHPDRTVSRGFEYPRCDVLVLTVEGTPKTADVDGQAMRIALRSVPETGTAVISAHLPRVVQLCQAHRGATVIYAQEPLTLPQPLASAAQGMVFTTQSHIVFRRNGRDAHCPIPAAWRQLSAEAWLPAVAACWANFKSLAVLSSTLASLTGAARPAAVRRQSHRRPGVS
jgi:cyanophycin synthetase